MVNVKLLQGQLVRGLGLALVVLAGQVEQRLRHVEALRETLVARQDAQKSHDAGVEIGYPGLGLVQFDVVGMILPSAVCGIGLAEGGVLLLRSDKSWVVGEQRMELRVVLGAEETEAHGVHFVTGFADVVATCPPAGHASRPGACPWSAPCK
ncbi:hypothetical protein PG991_009201 [Apiospora marii]|uniref:Secreted protein n=1 Tax=Apiospora marii TaxID=335849 RepID=A0ABR1RKA1_9PEZI